MRALSGVWERWAIVRISKAVVMKVLSYASGYLRVDRAGLPADRLACGMGSRLLPSCWMAFTEVSGTFAFNALDMSILDIDIWHGIERDSAVNGMAQEI
jgi:hypothetical protein